MEFVVHPFNFLFLLFLPLSMFLFYQTTSTKVRSVILLAASTLFYYYWEKERILLLYVIIFITWFLGKKIVNRQHKALLYVGIITNAAILLFYKCIPLTASSYLNTSLPIGLSFYAFQAISYLVDTYKSPKQKSDSWLEVANYLSFFPKILAGPIEKSDFLVSQLNKKPLFRKQIIFTACKIILLALCCKYVIADSLGEMVDSSLTQTQDLSSIDILMVAGLYSFQIFFDFYAYSILAIGVGRLYGIRLSRNFNYPYFSSSFREFWKRWNISLTSWLKEYIYIPLGGNKVSTCRWILNSMTVFLVSGCWHGGSINYIIWGTCHGLFYLAEQYNKRFIPNGVQMRLSAKIIYRLFVFLVVSLLWLIFRVEDTSLLFTLFGRLLSMDIKGTQILMIVYFHVTIFLILWAKKTLAIDNYIFKTRSSFSFILKEICLINLLIGSLLFFSQSSSNPFIYFKY